MVEEVSLRVSIDARPAAAGADGFKRSAAEIIRSAKKMGRVVEKVDVAGEDRGISVC